MLQKHERQAYNALSQVATINEIAMLWGLSYSGVMYHIDEGNISAIQSTDNRWILWVPSVYLCLGRPPHPGRRCRNIITSIATLDIPVN